ncbi:MAG: hypothetical protein KDD77_14725 [Caldilineaceae bacterium]|nr:hypothetical protein [Caldilineaceae bacterium]
MRPDVGVTRWDGHTGIPDKTAAGDAARRMQQAVSSVSHPGQISLSPSDVNPMKRALAYIGTKNDTFAQHPIFDYLKDESVPAQQRLVFAPYMAHFVFSFMDINRFILRDARSDDRLQHLVNIHTEEDSHHWPWYLNDLTKLQLNHSKSFTDALYFIWSDHGIRSRMITYDMVGLAKQASPIGRVILVEVIEKTGNVFLARTADVCALLDNPADYLYFGKHHLSCESGHHMGTPDIENVLEAIELTDSELDAGIQLIDATYTLYEQFLTEMLAFARRHDYQTLVSGNAYPASISRDEQNTGPVK